MVEVSIASASILEGTGGAVSLVFDITLSEASLSDVTVNYRTLGGTADSDFDFVEANTFFTISAGDTSTTVSISLVEDALDEADENFILELFNPVNAVFPGTSPTLRANGTILDDDGAGGNLALFVNDLQILESDGGGRVAVFEVILSRPPATGLTLDYTTSDGSAKAGSDYTAT
ncbi:MAG: Calx-beta domain-containing protein, partial [Pseudomonadota bacterium]